MLLRRRPPRRPLTPFAPSSGGTLSETIYGYDDQTGRLASISHGGSTATYDWSSTVGGLPAGISYSGAGLTGIRTQDAEGRLDKIAWELDDVDVLSHDYTLDERGRRTRAAREDGTHWDYGYNDRGEVTAAAHERADNAALPGRDFSYAFDSIGNRVTSSVAFSQPPPQTSAYTSNPLNQYTQISRSNPLRRIVQGLAHPEATVEVRLDGPAGQSRTVARVEPNGAGFMAEAEADTALAGVWRQVVVEASRPGVGVNGGPVTTKRTGWLFFPPQNETLVYDADGNLTEDARWLYTWDGENRLTVMVEKAIANASPGATPPARKRLEFGYDHQGRRVSKQVYEERESDGVLNWAMLEQRRFVYDGWNLIAEMDVNGNLEVRNLRSYAWGYDLSGTEQGAGGVGGLVLVKQPPATVNNSQLPSTSALAPCYDGNGNILAYMDCATGAVAQRMEYDAFGNELTLDSVLNGGGSSIREVPFRFSTKYTDAETNLSYYGYRYYSAEMGRWVNRDPIEEQGGANLHEITGNNVVNMVDLLGMCSPTSVIVAKNGGSWRIKGVSYDIASGTHTGLVRSYTITWEATAAYACRSGNACCGETEGQLRQKEVEISHWFVIISPMSGPLATPPVFNSISNGVGSAVAGLLSTYSPYLPVGADTMDKISVAQNIANSMPTTMSEGDWVGSPPENCHGF